VLTTIVAAVLTLRRLFPVALLFCCHLAMAGPVLLLCVTKTVTQYGGGITYRENGSYQITFDEVASTVAVDRGPAVRAAITSTLIDWGDDSTGGAWHIDRLTGLWSHWQFSESNQAIGSNALEKVSGICTAPPKRKF
jgi:hypothetical protein